MQYANDFLPHGKIPVRRNVANEMYAVLCTTAKSVDTGVARRIGDNDRSGVVPIRGIGPTAAEITPTVPLEVGQST